MYISDEKIEEIRAASDIADVVGDYLRLKRRGSNYFGLCPFHQEKTPSFSVNPGMGIFKCFGCGVGGNVFQFVMQVERVGFPESVRMLAERAGIPLPEADVQVDQANEVESIYYALRFAGRFFFQQLTQTEAGQPARSYLKGRGFTQQTIKQFGLGYAPDAWDALLTAATEHHLDVEVLEQAGLLIARKDGSGYYDRYRDRVIFPIFSHVGKVLGFGGRVLKQHTDQPKYINSPETKVYNKSRVLYGLYQAKQAIRREEDVILVEGYTDVISLHQAGVENVVASSGTALTVEQVKVLSRYAKRVVLLYDADAAGAAAALRGIDLVLEQGLSVYAVALPGGADPDSYVRDQGADAFKAYVQKHRQDFASFMYAEAHRAGRLDTPEGQAETMRSVVASIARMPDPLMQETYMRRASEVLNVYDSKLYQVLGELQHEQKRKALRETRRVAVAESAAQRAEANAPIREERALEAVPAFSRGAEPLPEEKTLIRLMLENGTALVELILGNMALDEFTEGPARDVVRCFLQMYEAGHIDQQRFFDGSLDAGIQSLAAEVLMDRHAPSENWERRQKISVPRLNEDPFEAAASAMTLLKLDRVDLAIERQREKMFKASRNEGDLRTLQEEMMALHGFRKQIEQRAFLSWNT